MIQVNNLTKQYGGVTVVNIPSLTIPRSESFGLVGNNGAGKTTFFRMLLDLVKPESGEVLSDGFNVRENEEWKKHTGSFLDEGFLIDFLTPEEYFYFLGDLHGISKDQVNKFLERFADFFNDEILSKKKYVRTLSKGNQKKVGIAAALIGEPDILVLDEPFASLDPSSQIRLKKLLKDLQTEKQVTMLISSHDLNHVTEVCGRIVVLDKGDIVHDIKTTENTLKELESYFSVED
ncbi:MAG: ABC transporter ATP-binding protein [Bacteroidales bacterium]|nr:ABC transporter ATP-binding protein [Bacteroidales bacterium]MCF8456741.1 ABC transporter ATP-binding protein [Bacteroidales bacterium]